MIFQPRCSLTDGRASLDWFENIAANGAAVCRLMNRYDDHVAEFW
jgi:hypothetical protein